MFRNCAAFALVAAVFTAAGSAQQTASLATLLTTAESSGFKSTSTHADVVKFLQTVDAASPLVHYTTYGKTSEGREMPLVVVGTGLANASASAVRATNRLRVHIQANIHAGEVEGKEAAQILLRELAMGQHADWLRSMVLIITPIYNADGNERFALTNRGRQNGPINGMGTRAQAQGINLNRDYMKLDAPEGQASAKLWVDYDPHVSFDLHTSDGSAHGYFLTYSPPLNPNTSDLIMNVMKNEWFPFVTKTVKQKYGWDMFYYGNVAGGGRRGGRAGGAPGAPGGGQAAGAQTGGAAVGQARAGGAAGQTTGGQVAGRAAGQAAAGAQTGRGQGGVTPEVVGAPPQAGAMRTWATFEHVPRFHNNYVGLRNRFALLSEAFAYATFEDRIKATGYFVEEALNFAHQNADRLKRIVSDLDRQSIVGQTLGTRAQMKAGPPIEILMGEVEDEVNPVNGAVMNRRKDVVKPEMMIDRLWFEPTSTEEVPAEYFIPAAATKAIELLRKHGVQMRQVTSPVTGVEQFTITSNTTRPPTGSIDTQQHALRTLAGSWAAAQGVTVPGGSWAVPMNQPLGRLAFYLLAPTSDDGVTTWNFLDEFLGEGTTTYPIMRKR